MDASDHDGACTRLLAFLDKVCVSQAFLRIGTPKLRREVVIADTPREDDRVGWEDVLPSALEIDQSREAYGTLTAAPLAAFCDAPPATYVIGYFRISS